MTDAPDPELTDLIAAHHPSGHYMATNEIRCGCGWLGPASDWPAHVALVVEQHTNGRHEWPKTTPTGHTYERPTTYVELVRMSGHMVQGEIECWEAAELPPEPVWEMVGIAQQEVERERSRAEKAEATVARVRAVEADYLDPEDTDIECREDVWRFIRDLRAALEGEQQ